MYKVLDVKEAKEWAGKNLYEADNFMFPLDVAVKRGLLKPVGEEHYAVVEHEVNGCIWHLDEVRKLSDKEMKENDLYCRYRYKAHVISVPEGYAGATEICAGISF